MTVSKMVSNWRIQIFLDEDRAELLKTNDIVEDGIVISRTIHSTLTCPVTLISEQVDAVIAAIETGSEVQDAAYARMSNSKEPKDADHDDTRDTVREVRAKVHRKRSPEREVARVGKRTKQPAQRSRSK